MDPLILFLKELGILVAEEEENGDCDEIGYKHDEKEGGADAFGEEEGVDVEEDPVELEVSVSQGHSPQGGRC